MGPDTVIQKGQRSRAVPYSNSNFQNLYSVKNTLTSIGGESESTVGRIGGVGPGLNTVGRFGCANLSNPERGEGSNQNPQGNQDLIGNPSQSRTHNETYKEETQLVAGEGHGEKRCNMETIGGEFISWWKERGGRRGKRREREITQTRRQFSPWWLNSSAPRESSRSGVLFKREIGKDQPLGRGARTKKDTTYTEGGTREAARDGRLPTN